MGLRFRKSVKICKGVKVNFSKSGASLSLGGKGHSVNFGGRGTRMTAGIPGTGLSYSTKIGGSRKRKSSSRRRKTTSRSSVSVPSSVNLIMNEKGEIFFKDAKGKYITDEAVIRKIKQTSVYKTQKENLERQRKEKIKDIVADAVAENAKFIEIYKYAPYVMTRDEFEYEVNNMELPEYDVERPTEESVKQELKEEAEDEITGLLAFIKRKEYVDENLQTRLQEEIEDWEADKEDFEIAFEQQKVLMRNLLAGDTESIFTAFNNWISDIELPVEMAIDYDWNDSNKTMMLDVDLPEIEDLPSTIMSTTSAGNLKEKKKTQAELRSEYATVVFGLAVFICSNVFNMSPEIQRILISGYTQRRDKEGNLNDDYIYSIKFPRGMFEGKELSELTPDRVCLIAENRCNQTSTGLFKTIVPYDE